jgi:hypothetical protein
MFVPFLRFSTDATMLAIEAQTVISARFTQFALGQGTGAETNLMVSEKILAWAEAAFTVAAGGSVHEVVRGYRKHVRANMRRLSSSSSPRPMGGQGAASSSAAVDHMVDSPESAARLGLLNEL